MVWQRLKNQFHFLRISSLFFFISKALTVECKIQSAQGLQSLLSELRHDKTNKMACASSKDSDQPEHLPSLIRVFAVRSIGS